MFHFTGYGSYGPIVFRPLYPDITLDGFPHSDIHGSTRACRFPWLIATYYVLHRLSSPRHPPCALSSLITNYPSGSLLQEFQTEYSQHCCSLPTTLYAIVKEHPPPGAAKIKTVTHVKIVKTSHRRSLRPSGGLNNSNPFNVFREGWWAR